MKGVQVAMLIGVVVLAGAVGGGGDGVIENLRASAASRL